MMSKSNLKFSKIKFPWRLEIHCWGGLGSQLFAWAFAEELMNSGFGRRITLVLHSSGVTNRVSEINHLSGYMQIRNVHDFSTSMPSTVTRRSNIKNSKFRGKMIAVLSALQIIIFSDDFQNIRPWTIQVRSHYSHRTLSNKTLNSIMSILKKYSTVGHADNYITAKTAIHYRLGDLLTLENKTFVSADRVFSALERINNLEERGLKNVDVFSDSPEVAIDKLSSRNVSFQFNSIESSSWDVIVHLLNYPNFIATNSKIGIWVALLRQLGESTQTTIVPRELEPTFKFLLPDQNSMNRIVFY